MVCTSAYKTMAPKIAHSYSVVDIYIFKSLYYLIIDKVSIKTHGIESQGQEVTSACPSRPVIYTCSSSKLFKHCM